MKRLISLTCRCPRLVEINRLAGLRQSSAFTKEIQLPRASGSARRLDDLRKAFSDAAAIYETTLLMIEQFP